MLILSLGVIFSFYSCSDEVLEADSFTSKAQIQKEIVEVQADNVRDIKDRKSYCTRDAAYYVNNHIVPKGTTASEGCQVAICTALHDLNTYYETETISIITEYNLVPSSENELGIYIPPSYSATTTDVEVLTSNSAADALAYLSTIEDNIIEGDPYYEYWYAFYTCYRNQMPFNTTLNAPISGL